VNVKNSKPRITSLRAQLYQTLFPILIISLVTLIGTFNYFSYKQALKNFDSTLQRNTKEQAEYLASNMHSQQINAINNFLKIVFNDKDIIGAYVLLNDAQLIAEVGYPITQLANTRIINQPIIFNDTGTKQTLGQLKIAYTDENVKAIIFNKLLFEFGMVAISLLLISLVILRFNRRSIEEPLANLLQAINGKDPDSAPVEWKVKDEIGQAIEAFNAMHLRQQQQERQLKNTKIDLERQVAARTQELSSALKEQKSASKVKDEFLAAMSHEIRTPMNGIIGLSELLLDGKLQDFERKQIEIILSSARMLLHIINDILDISKLEAAKYEVIDEDLDINHLLNEIKVLLQEPAKKNGTSIMVKCDQAVPSKLIGDVLKIRQILTNLVGNAIKFSEQGKVTVMVSVKEQRDPYINLQFKIVDNGCGIEKDKLANLFEKFNQIDSSMSRKYGGSGLGLAISKGLVDLMNGEIGVESQLGQGSVFWFNLPLKLKSAQPSAESKASIENRKVEINPYLQILVAEDNLVNQMVVVGILNKYGLNNVDIANTGLEVINAVENKHYDLILMDIQMPEMDGVEATRIIRARTDAAKDIPIIALTANMMQGDKEKYLQEGIDEYVGKPIQRQQLVTAIQQVTQKTSALY
jgi:signal transduction histidine kinase/BarA-like signal transduction histidine kinase